MEGWHEGLGGGESIPSATNRDGSRYTYGQRVEIRGYEEWQGGGGGGSRDNIERVDVRGKRGEGWGTGWDM